MYCKKSYIGKTGMWLGDRFWEHLHNIDRNVKDASKPVTRHSNISNHSKQHMTVCGLSLNLSSSASCETLEQITIF